ncbi:hypothetical protein [Citricoccus alkalitolerans]|uniref:Uncharacterized protein n=1 Tax=Citricoccus alkalitolerans TaxID=246603 RepID=A0ABV8XXV5_9MICC
MAKARRSSPRRPLAVRCAWCDEPLPDPSMGRRYCSDAHRQAAYRARRRSVLQGSEVDQLRAQLRSLEDDRRLLELQLQGAESRAAEAARDAEQYATIWEGVVRSNGQLVSSLAASEEQAEKLRTELETSGVRHAYRYGYEKGHMDAGKQMSRREDVDDLTAYAQLAGHVEGYEDGSHGRPKLTIKDMLPRG